MFDDRWRRKVDANMAPWGARLGRIGISPNFLTAFGLICAITSAVLVGMGYLLAGFIVFVFSALPDLLDGAVARATKAASSRGAYFDSVADRVSDSAYMVGMAWYLADTQSAHAAMLPVLVLAVSSLIPYQRAKAESLGFYAKGGLLERGERSLMIGVALAFPGTMMYVLWAMLVLSAVTVVQRFVKVWRQASAHVIPRRRIMVAQRWEAWREQYVDSLRMRRVARYERREARREARASRRNSRP